MAFLMPHVCTFATIWHGTMQESQLVCSFFFQLGTAFSNFHLPAYSFGVPKCSNSRNCFIRLGNSRCGPQPLVKVKTFSFGSGSEFSLRRRSNIASSRYVTLPAGTIALTWTYNNGDSR